MQLLEELSILVEESVAGFKREDELITAAHSKYEVEKHEEKLKQKVWVREKRKKNFFWALLIIGY